MKNHKNALCAVLAAVIFFLVPAACSPGRGTDSSASKSGSSSKSSGLADINSADTNTDTNTDSSAEGLDQAADYSGGSSRATGEASDSGSSAPGGYYDYYELYETNPANWSKDSSGRATVRNLPEYSFDEDKYYGVKMQSSGYTRTENFIRGITGDYRHVTEGYNLSAATTEKDAAIIPTLNLSGFRYWTAPTQSALQSNIISGLKNAYTSGSFRTLFPESVSQNGAADGYNFVGVSSLISQFNETALSLKNLTALKGMSVYLMANEFHNFTNHGFDADTQEYFKHTWLPSRYGSLANMNKHMGTVYPSFSEVFYNSGRDQDAKYGGKSGNGMSYEFYLCRRYLYETAVKTAYNIWHAANPDLPIGMATYGQNGDTYGPLSRLDFLNMGASNLYPDERSRQATWAFDIDRYLTTYSGRPFYITEMGYSNKSGDSWTDDTLAPVARGMKQSLALAYMRPQVQGTYWFNYGYMKDSSRGANAIWGVVDPWHNRTLLTDTMGQVYGDFLKLDNWYTGVSSAPIVAISDGTLGQRRYSAFDTDLTAKALYAKGVTLKVVRTMEESDLAGLTLNKLIWTEKYLAQSPTGKDDVAGALKSYLKKSGNTVIYMGDEAPKTQFGIGSLGADTLSGLEKLYPGFTSKPVSTQGNYQEIWETLAPFIHGDFISGKISVKKNTVDNTAVRILDTFTQQDGFSDMTYEVQQQLVYKDGHVYLALVNSGGSAISELNITLGVNIGTKFNLHPKILAADGNVSAGRSDRALVPQWAGKNESKVAYGTVTVNNLDTYAFIDLGMAVVE